MVELVGSTDTDYDQKLRGMIHAYQEIIDEATKAEIFYG